jgi:RNA polymerase sigma-70 factor (ECF subfamily)
MTGADEFEAFVRRYQDMVFATALRLLGSPAEAEDVAQTVFLKAFERFDQIGRSDAAAGWLKTATRNACLNHLARYRSRWRLFSELARDEAPPAHEGVADSAPSPEDLLTAAVDLQALERALMALPDHQRVPLVLYHFEEASYQDIATALGVSLAKVKSDIHRGRLALSRALRPLGPVVP